MNKRDIVNYLSRLDAGLSAPVVLYVYGSVVVILLDAPGRTIFIQAVRRRMDRPVLDDREVPPHLVRDLGLPEFCRTPRHG
jgi:hypothetical protein